MSSTKNAAKYKLSKKNLLSLFLICIFPTHVWSFYIFFEQTDWLTEWGVSFVFGILSYFLAIALVESVILFLFIAGIHRMLPLNFPETKIKSFFSLAAWSICLGMILAQFTYDQISNHTIMWLFIFAFIALLIFTGYRFLNYQRFVNLTNNIFGRIEVLSNLFLGLDALAILNILIRNFF